METLCNMGHSKNLINFMCGWSFLAVFPGQYHLIRLYFKDMVERTLCVSTGNALVLGFLENFMFFRRKIYFELPKSRICAIYTYIKYLN